MCRLEPQQWESLLCVWNFCKYDVTVCWQSNVWFVVLVSVSLRFHMFGPYGCFIYLEARVMPMLCLCNCFCAVGLLATQPPWYFMWCGYLCTTGFFVEIAISMFRTSVTHHIILFHSWLIYFSYFWFWLTLLMFCISFLSINDLYFLIRLRYICVNFTHA
jgi:hypothetical protein